MRGCSSSAMGHLRVTSFDLNVQPREAGAWALECIQFRISRYHGAFHFRRVLVSEPIEGFKDNSRRKFLKGLTATPMAALAAGDGLLAQAVKQPEGGAVAAPQRQGAPAPFPPPGKRFVAIQIGARSFVDEGVDQCLDTLR